MDFVPRTKKSSTKKSAKGHTIVNTPGSSIRTHKSNNIDLSNDDNVWQYTDNDTNQHINEINYPGGDDISDSSGSNFSKGNNNRHQTKYTAPNVARKRQQTEEQLIAYQQESQQKWDRKRQGLSLEDAYQETSLYGTDNDRHNRKKKVPRGKTHGESCFAGLGSEKKKRERTHDHSPFGTNNYSTSSNYDDPLDVAMEQQQQDTGRHSSRGSLSRKGLTKKVGDAMNTMMNRASMKSHRQRRKESKEEARSQDEIIDLESTRDHGNEGSSGKKRKTSRHFDLPDSPNSSSSVKQGDDGFHVDGDFDSSQGSGRRSDYVMAALDGANQRVSIDVIESTRKAKRRKSPPQHETNFNFALGLGRDPKKNDVGKRKSAKSAAKLPNSTPIPRFKSYLQRQKDPLVDSDDDSVAGQHGESARKSSAGWISTNKESSQLHMPRKKRKDKTYAKSDNTRKKGNRQGMRYDDDADDDYADDKEWRVMEQRQSQRSLARSSSATRRTRSKTRKAKNKDEVIEILDSSSEEESSDEEEMFSPGRDESNRIVESATKPPSVADLMLIDAARISVGKKVFKSKCALKFQLGTKTPYMLFCWNNTQGEEQSHKVSLKGDADALTELNYYIPDDKDNNESDGTDEFSFIAFKITPTKGNKFGMYTKSYDENSYIVVEVRDSEQFQILLEQIRENQALATFFGTDPQLEFYQIKEYTTALDKDTKKEVDRRRSSRIGRSKSKKKGNILEKPLLVFPFKADEEVFSTAASNLNELREAREISDGESIPLIQPQDSDLNESDVKVKGSSRTHYITIREDDVERLAPGEFLNDALVDFWMKWISGAPNNSNADVHIFTSHFMSTLASDGPQAVSSWTAKKKIDIFEKKLIFVPVNSDLHWSLAVVVNPGFIANNSDEEIYEDSRTDEGSFLLFLDSLTMHRKKRIASDIYKWLNFEWNRLEKGNVNGDSPRVFRTETMPLLTPKIPYQDNGCDCGVFVCRYAYNLFQMRNNYIFSQYDLFTRCKKLFKECRLFEFGMEDIARIREEMKSLIHNLSTSYLRMKKLEKGKKKGKCENDEAAPSEEGGNSSGEVAAADETSNGANKPDGVSTDNDEGGNADVMREEGSDDTPEETTSLSTEKENVENSSDASPKDDDEVKVNAEQDDVSCGTEKSEDLLDTEPSASDAVSITC